VNKIVGILVVVVRFVVLSLVTLPVVELVALLLSSQHLALHTECIQLLIDSN